MVLRPLLQVALDWSLDTHHSWVELQRRRFLLGFKLVCRASILALQQFWGELTLMRRLITSDPRTTGAT